MSDFSTRLKELRVRRGLRQKDLAVAIGLAQTTIANYEQKLRFPDEPTLVKIADFFSITLDYLMGRSSNAIPVEDEGEGAAHQSSLNDRELEYLTTLRNEGVEPARAGVRAALAQGVPVRELYLRVFAPALYEVGRLWERGELSVSEEHRVSEATLAIMAGLAPLPVDSDGQVTRARAMVFAVDGESHLIGPRIVADFLTMAGMEVRFLGGGLSLGLILEALRAWTPDLVALSVTLADHRNSAEELVRAIRAERALSRVKIMIGGQAFHGRPHEGIRTGADGFARDAEEAVTVARQLLSRAD
jgi:MerR family transcriptional regulator, light-induced transcriptional regulator